MNKYDPNYPRQKEALDAIQSRMSQRAAAATPSQQDHFKALVADCDPRLVPMERLLMAMFQSGILTSDEAIEITDDLVACGAAARR